MIPRAYKELRGYALVARRNQNEREDTSQLQRKHDYLRLR